MLTYAPALPLHSETHIWSLHCNTDKSKHPWGLTLGNANTCPWMHAWECVSKASRYLPSALIELFRNPPKRLHTESLTHTLRVKPGGSISAWPGVPSSAARWTTCRSQVWPSPGKGTTQLLLQPQGEKEKMEGLYRISGWKQGPLHTRQSKTQCKITSNHRWCCHHLLLSKDNFPFVSQLATCM